MPEQPNPDLFDSLEGLYKAARSSFVSFLKGLRKSRLSAARGSRRRTPVSSLTTGRSIRALKFMPGQNRLAPLQSILAAGGNGHYDRTTGRVSVDRSDMVGWQYQEFESLTLIMLIDVSNSTYQYIEMFRQILESMAGYFRRNNDRVGLISLQGTQSQVYSHPTHNFRVVARGLTKLKIHGHTPLSDGLYKALHMSRAEQNKNPGSRCVVILLSDCYPEPMTGKYDDIWDEPAYRDSLNAAATFRRRKVSLLVINPTYSRAKATMPGEILSEKLVEASRGRLIRFRRPSNQPIRKPTRREMDQLLRGIEQSFSQPGRWEDNAGNRLIN